MGRKRGRKEGITHNTIITNIYSLLCSLFTGVSLLFLHLISSSIPSTFLLPFYNFFHLSLFFLILFYSLFLPSSPFLLNISYLFLLPFTSLDSHSLPPSLPSLYSSSSPYPLFLTFSFAFSFLPFTPPILLIPPSFLTFSLPLLFLLSLSVLPSSSFASGRVDTDLIHHSKRSTDRVLQPSLSYFVFSLPSLCCPLSSDT